MPDCAERLAWLTGYTGSAGSVLVLADKAHLFVDGRYTNQVRAQTDPKVFEYQDSVATPLASFLETSGLTGIRLGIDPWTWPSSEVTRLEAALKTLDGQLVFLDRNPVDLIWEDRPQPLCQRPRGLPLAAATAARHRHHPAIGSGRHTGTRQTGDDGQNGICGWRKCRGPRRPVFGCLEF